MVGSLGGRGKGGWERRQLGHRVDFLYIIFFFRIGCNSP